jgi:SAM-dependent methyltransferase
MTDQFAARAVALTDGIDFYPDKQNEQFMELRTQLMSVIEETLKSSPESSRSALLGELTDHIENWRPNLLSNNVNPVRPDVDRTAFEEPLEQALAHTKDVGAVHLELGTWTAFPDERVNQLCKEDGLSEFIRLDFEQTYKPDVVADVTALPFANDSLDRVGSNSLFEHVAYPHRIIEESFRVLRPGGVMVVTMPFTFSVHGYPDDYVRLTPSFFELICKQVGFTEVYTDNTESAGLYYTLHNSAKAALVETSDPADQALKNLHELTMLLLGTLIPFDRFFGGQARQWFHSVRCFAVKPGQYVAPHRKRTPETPFVERALDLLADPKTARPLKRVGDTLVSKATPVGSRYPIVDGIPLLSERKTATTTEWKPGVVRPHGRSAVRHHLSRVKRKLLRHR